MPKLDQVQNILALDIGASRIGVAKASLQTYLAQPLITIDNDQQFLTKLAALVAEQGVGILVIGLPRGLNGQDTDQTMAIRRQTEQIQAELDVQVVYQDEALTSIKAKEELLSRGKDYQKSDIDKLAACYILEDYIQDHILKRA